MALHEAVKTDDLNLIAKLLAHGANIDERDERGDHVLHIAVKRRLPNVVQMLLAHGADSNVRDIRGDSPLHMACWRSWEWDNGRKTIAELLLLHGAHVNARNTVNIFVDDDEDERHDVAAGGSTPLHFAVDWATIDAIELLLSHGADISIQEGEGYSSLHWAIQCHTAEVWEERNRNHDAPTRLPTPQNTEKAIQVVRMLLAYGSDTSGKIARLQAQTLDSLTVEDVAFTPDMKDILHSAMDAAQEEHQSKLNAFSMGHHARLGAASHICALDLEVIQMIMDLV
mgnify:CR=1 FL=1